MSLLPSSPDISPESDPRVVGLDSEEADELMSALSSATARRLLTALHDEPAPPGELADRVETSLQNAQYHLEKLEDAGAIEVVGTAYSEKGREMRVYGPADDPLVIFAGEEKSASGLRAALSQLLGGLAALAGGSVIVQELFGTSLFGRDDAAPDAPEAEPTPTPGPAPEEEDDAEDDVGMFDADDEEPAADEETPAPEAPEETPAPEPDPTPAPEPTPAMEPTPAPEAAETAFEALLAGGLPPGLAFFLGGAIVLVAVVALAHR